MDDPFNLQRFVDAQSLVYPTVLRELRAGRKTSHWIWFIFPQEKGLGRSAMSERYAISSLDEARAYLAHPILGPRLKECAGLVRSHRQRAAGRHPGRTRRQEVQVVDGVVRARRGRFGTMRNMRNWPRFQGIDTR